MKKAVVIGAGFSGIAAATHLAHNGWKVKVVEKNDSIGGRARQFSEDGFVFDMGPSWYWMPDIFEDYFQTYGKSVEEYYQLIRLDPSYKVFFGENDHWDMPASMEELYTMFENEEAGSAEKLKFFLNSAEYKYNVGIKEFVHKPGLSITEFFSPDIVQKSLKMDLWTNVAAQVRASFQSERLRSILEFPVLFLGERSWKIPAMYTLMNHADMKLGTWYPIGGMYKIIEAMHQLAESKGVEFITNSPIEKFRIEGDRIIDMEGVTGLNEFDSVIASADYHHVEQNLLNKEYRQYSSEYWESRAMAPSSLLFYLGIDKKLENLLHHNLFFDEDFKEHADEIYETKQWPNAPLFYACCPSKTDPTVAPAGKENLFLLIPVAPGLEDTKEVREHYYNLIMTRLEKLTGQSVKEHVIYKRTYAHSNFKSDYNAFKGNAYGLANTLKQTAILKPSIKSKKVKNLYYTGQLTVPGPGVPPSLISGKIVANQVIKDFNS